MSTTTTTEWPEVVDERNDDRWWQCIRQSVDLVIKTKVQNSKTHFWLDEKWLYAEKSSVPLNTDVGLVLSMEDPRVEAAEEIKGLVPFFIKNLDDTIIIAPDSTINYDYPDIQNLIYSMFQPQGELKPGTVLVPIKADAAV